ncbi:MAG: 2-oxoacid:acceptor oxidoreductase subunit alpha [Desulfobacteraceae bacterium]|jgi:2-oxoglutarate ferredoxin oxidoreductase subunit alpha
MGGDVNIMVAGAAGQGMQTIGAILGKVFVRGGCQVFAIQDNESRIRGGHNFFQIRLSQEPVMAVSMPLHVLVALNLESIEKHMSEMAHEGVVLFDSERNEGAGEGAGFLGLPLEQLAVEKGGNKILSNSVAVGATLAVLGWDFKPLEDFLKEYFAAKADVVEGNIKAARAGYDNALKQKDKYTGRKIPPRDTEPNMLVSGHEAVALGALTAGCQFMSAYPMSPSTSVMVFLAGKADDFDMVVEQAEDEIGAINMAIGASYAGIRSLTATSGGGFSLMVEALGLAGISETPLVVVEAQRPGPATGLPTRTEQADLLFILHASQDEFPRFILAPGTAQEAFTQTIKAFDLAEKYQVPVILLTDQFLADSYYTEKKFDISKVEIKRHLLSEREAAGMTEYKRYQFTGSGISPRAVPSAYGFEVVADSHEHDESGHITEDAQIRKEMKEKRFRKLTGMAKEISPPKQMGDQRADLLLVGWGSTYGPMAEAVQLLNADGVPVRGLHLGELWPFPGESVSKTFKSVKKWVVVENNYTGQLARLIQMELQQKPDALITKYTGRPFMPAEIADAFRKEVLG